VNTYYYLLELSLVVLLESLASSPYNARSRCIVRTCPGATTSTGSSLRRLGWLCHRHNLNAGPGAQAASASGRSSTASGTAVALPLAVASVLRLGVRVAGRESVSVRVDGTPLVTPVLRLVVTASLSSTATGSLRCTASGTGNLKLQVAGPLALPTAVAT
jgi:hypothetical protein